MYMQRPLAALVVVMSAVAGCGGEAESSAVFEVQPDSVTNRDGLGLTRTEVRMDNGETAVTVSWQHALDPEARRERSTAVFVMFFRRGATRPSAMMMASLADGRAVRCGARQLDASAPWVFAQSGPFVECPDFPEARVETEETTVSLRWHESAFPVPDDEWVVRMASHPPGGPPIEEYLPSQPGPVEGWPSKRAPERA
jgi:hypothetical protein